MKNNKKIGLCLSGGGYRATIYHLGTFRKLRELGLLDKIDVISSISGGSITNAFYGLNKDNFKAFEKGLLEATETNIIRGVLRSWKLRLILLFAISGWLGSIAIAWNYGNFSVLLPSIIYPVVIGLLLHFFQFKVSISNSIAGLLGEKFFQNKTLKDLPDTPHILINATNIDTGRHFSFSQVKMGDSAYSYRKGGKIDFEHENFPIAYAVLASACFPPMINPIKIHEQYYKDKHHAKKISPLLIDGGLYDNQGVHKLTHKKSSYKCDVVIVSDAGTGMKKRLKCRNSIHLLLNTIELLMNRVKNFLMVDNVYNESKEHFIAYQSLTWKIDACVAGFVDALLLGNIKPEVIELHEISEDDIVSKNRENLKTFIKSKINYAKLEASVLTEDEYKLACAVPTCLTPLSEKERNVLIKQAEVLTEIQLKLYCPFLLEKENLC